MRLKASPMASSTMRASPPYFLFAMRSHVKPLDVGATSTTPVSSARLVKVGVIHCCANAPAPCSITSSGAGLLGSYDGGTYRYESREAERPRGVTPGDAVSVGAAGRLTSVASSTVP